MSVRLSDIQTYERQKITVMGLGTFGGGVAAAQFLAQRGAEVTITDLRTAEQLSDSLQALANVPIRNYFLGGHPAEAFQDATVIVRNPAVKPSSDIIAACTARGAVITSEIELFLKHNAGRIVAVTGSNGKSTTTALIHHLLSSPSLNSDDAKVFLGGNIGVSLLPIVDTIHPGHTVVLELSSFQLNALRNSDFRPHVAVITNFSPNHLDWHGSLDHYRSSKQVILKRQQPTDFAVIPDSETPTDVDTWPVRATRMRFGLRDTGEDGAFIEDGALILRSHTREDAVRLHVPSQLPGNHNLLNIACAACAAWTAGANPETFSQKLMSFQPLPHRLQLVAESRGIRFYNDSIATTPESAIAALKTFRQPMILLAGGASKGSDFGEFVNAIHKYVTAVVLMGDTAETLSELLKTYPVAEPALPQVIARDFRDAFSQAVALAKPGSIVLLSPGCASYGWFRDFRDRGDQFTALATTWQTSPSGAQAHQ